MSTTLLSIKTDQTTKHDLQQFAAELGISTTAFVNLVVKQALRDRRVVLSTVPEPSPYLQDIMRQADVDYKTGRGITHTRSPKDALSHLGSLMD